MRPHPSILFVVLVVVAIFLGDRAISLILSPLYRADLLGQTGGHINTYLRRPPPSVLVIGSSRAHRHVDPALLAPDGFNLHHNGMNVVFQAGLVEVLEEHEALPTDLLLVQLQPEDMITGRAAMRHMQFLRYYYGQVPHVTRTIDSLRWSERMKYMLTSYRFNGSAALIPINAMLSARDGAPIDNGYHPHPVQPADSAVVMRSAAHVALLSVAEFDTIPAELMSSPGGEAMSLMSSVCSRHGIQLVFFTAPYFECAPPRAKAYEQLDHAIRAAGFTYYNYACGVIPELGHTRYWKDNDHLNADGARFLTEQLRHDLRTTGTLR